jgi:predicted house-cleaning noncanonical NTP pyrophosphatase (MazG superfamily)|nr:MAG TPA: NTP-PPase-like protein [Caudoviricetes sp.]
MEKSKLTPFDVETFLMIESITGVEPEVVQSKVSYKISVCTYNLSDEKITAIKNAVSGRLGKRLYNTESGINKIVFSVEFQENAEKLPTEIRTDLGTPDNNAGKVFCRRLLEVRALPVKRDNLEKLLMFTGGGTMQIPRTPGGLAVYSFPTENGVMLDVPEGNYIVLTPDGKFGKMDMQTFMANFEEKDANTAGLTFDEKRLFEKMNKLFGKNFQMRFLKLTEEYHELFVVADDMLVNGIIPENTSEIIDELADLNAVLFHIAALFGYSQKELQEMAYKKIAGREKNPDFMRKHPHTEPGKYVCENCNKFEIRDGDDGGFCKEQKK